MSISFPHWRPVRSMMVGLAVFLAGCGGGSRQPVVEDVVVIAPVVEGETDPDDAGGSVDGDGDISEAGTDAPVGGAPDIPDFVADIVTVDVTGGTYIPTVFPIMASGSDVADQIIFENSGIVLIRRSVLSDALNEPGAIRQLLLEATGQDFPQAAGWTFRVLNNSDVISQLLFIRFRFYLPWFSPYANIVVGDEEDFIDTFIARYFPGLTPDSDTAGLTSDILTAGSSFATVSSSANSH